MISATNTNNGSTLTAAKANCRCAAGVYANTAATKVPVTSPPTWACQLIA